MSSAATASTRWRVRKLYCPTTYESGKEKELKKKKKGHLKIKNYKFERVENFKYLGVILNEDYNNQIDLQERKKNANKTYFMLQNLFKNRNIKETEIETKEHNNRQKSAYASETWTLTKRDRKQMNVFERKVYRRILGPAYDNEKENWMILTNKEIYSSVKKPTIIETISLNRLCWFGHVQRMVENRILKRVMYMNLGTTRLRGRPRNRWQDDVREDGRIVGEEGGQEKVHNREEWKKLLRMARNRRILHMPMEGMNEYDKANKSSTSPLSA